MRMHMCVCVCVRVHMGASVYRDQRHWIHLELEFRLL